MPGLNQRGYPRRLHPPPSWSRDEFERPQPASSEPSRCLYLPDFDVHSARSARQAQCSVPPAHALEPVHRFGSDPPAAVSSPEGVRRPIRRNSDQNALHGGRLCGRTDILWSLT